MKENASGQPEHGEHARFLGVRPEIDVAATSPETLVHPGQGGLSVSPDDPMHLPRHRRPPELHGVGRDPVWSIDADALGPDLRFRLDPSNAGHGFIEPVRPTPLGTYQYALSRTQSLWCKVEPDLERGDHSDAARGEF